MVLHLYCNANNKIIYLLSHRVLIIKKAAFLIFKNNEF